MRCQGGKCCSCQKNTESRGKDNGMESAKKPRKGGMMVLSVMKRRQREDGGGKGTDAEVFWKDGGRDTS